MRLHGRGVAPVALALLLSAGALQASPVLEWTGGYLRAALLATVAVGTARVLLGERPWIEAIPVGLVALIALSGAAHSPVADYGRTKSVNALLTTLLVGATVVLLADVRRRVRFLQGIVGVAVLVAVLAVVAPSSEVAAGRVAAAGATTIATGRIAGAGVVVLVAWAMSGWLHRRFLALAVVLVCSVVMFETGSRGPLLAAVVACAVMLMTTFARHPVRTMVIVAAAALVGWWAWSQSSTVAQERISSALSSDRGTSVSQREFMWSRSWEIATSIPVTQWRGWGNLSYPDLIVDRYPHNLFLEVLVEAGWLALLALVVLVAVGARRAFQERDHQNRPAALPLLGLLVFTLVNAMVSGDLTDNRIVFVVAAACWTLRTAQTGAAPGREATVVSMASDAS